MIRNQPIAFLLTWTCYGTWLSGNEKGSVDRKHRSYGWPRLEPDAGRVAEMRQRMKFDPLIFDPAMCAAVDSAIAETATFRNWHLLARNVRTNHVHVVVAAGVPPEKMLNDFKAYSTRRLRKQLLLPPDRPVWTDGGSTRYLWERKHLNRAMHYVQHEQGDDLFDRDDDSFDGSVDTR